MALTLWTLPQYVALCVAYDASFTAAAIEETFIHAGCTPDGHLTEQGLVQWLWQLTGAEDDLMLCGIAEELLELGRLATEKGGDGADELTGLIRLGTPQPQQA